MARQSWLDALVLSEDEWVKVVGRPSPLERQRKESHFARHISTKNKRIEADMVGSALER
jgi:hypothetical protein